MVRAQSKSSSIPKDVISPQKNFKQVLSLPLVAARMPSLTAPADQNRAWPPPPFSHDRSDHMHIRIGPWAAAMLAICGMPNNIVLAQPTTRPTSSTSPTTNVAPAPPAPEGGAEPGQLGKVVVTSESELDKERDMIAPSLGAATYTIGPDQIQNIPGGSNAPFQQVLIRAPGVVEDSFGQEHVRGEHANLTYRVNGVLLPQPLNGFGQELDTRLIQSFTLIDGSLPAQFGFHTAGIADITTKSGETLNSNELSFYGGSNDTFQPSLQLGGTIGKFDYFVTTSFNHSDIGIENPTSSHRPLHDYTNQERFFGYFAYRPDDTSRISLLANASDSDFQIPNTAGIAPAFPLAGHTFTDSKRLNENQNEQEYYTVLSYQKTVDQLSFQLSGFTHYGQIRFQPDPVGDLVFQGVAGKVVNYFVTNGVQFDGSYILNDQHTVRAGLVADYTTERLDANTNVFPVNGASDPTSDMPLNIRDNSGNRAWESGIYVQDEWRVTPKLTFNFGLRYDRFDANFDTEDQISPRANLVYKLDAATTAHAGYSRYFVPPPVQFVSSQSVHKFDGTTNASENQIADAPKVEKSNYYDIGISRQITKPWLVNVDGFYKQSHNLVDLGQFGAPVILAPFNYREGTVYGAEVSSTYTQGGFSAFGNFSWVKTAAHDIDSQQFLIGNDELAFIKNHDIHLDHEAEFAVSAGASYAWKNDRVYADILYATGLRSGFANTDHLKEHYPVNLGYEHIFRSNGSNKDVVKLRFDVINVFDQSYELRDGSGIGVGAAQFGARRAFFVGLSYSF
jgi:outer membrane receptor protein involved in Fe transport